jgi:hypothetical protein
VAKA